MRTSLLLVLFLMPGIVLADISVAPIFSDGVVLQRGAACPIWGRALAGEKITVKFGDVFTGSTVADSSGDWSLSLPVLKPSSKPRTIQVTGTSEITINDVLVGDVYYAGGQSNMAMTVGACAKSLDEMVTIAAESDFPAIRFTRIADGPSSQPLTWLKSNPKWTKCSPESVKKFSAAAFCCARRMHLETNVPIGIVDVSRGGTPIEPFIPRSAFVDHPTLVREAELGDKDDLAALQRLPGGVRARDANWLPGRLFNSRLAPIAMDRSRRFVSAGVLWYQGESNCGKIEDPRDYQVKMQALIASWLVRLSEKQNPFCFVQLPGSGAGPNWPYLREQQRLASISKDHTVGMVVTIDLEHPSIHPPNKIDVGERMAAFMLAHNANYAKGRGLPFNSPVFESATTIKNKVVIRFQSANDGSASADLMIAEKNGVEPATETPNATLNHFEVLDTNGNWHAANASIVGDRIEVVAANVKTPIAARYAYAISPSKCNLYSRSGFPASPFCTRPELQKVDPGLPE